VSLRSLAIELHQHGVVDIGAKGFLDRIEVSLVPVSRELHAVRQAVAKIVHEGQRIAAVATADHPRDDEFRLGLDPGPRPRVARALNGRLHLGDVLLLRGREAPNLVALNARRLHVAHSLIMEASASRSCVNKQLGDRVDAHVRNARDRPHGRSLAEHREDLGAFGNGELVHAPQLSCLASSSNFI
jgi:hypothetical protein